MPTYVESDAGSADVPGTTVPEQQLQQVLDDLQKLERAAHRISSVLDLNELIDRIVNEVALSFGLVRANVYLHDNERGELTVAEVHTCALYGAGDKLRLGKESLVGYVAATGQMRYAPDVSADPYYLRCDPSTRSEVAIPLHVEGRLVGVFSASHPELNAFSQPQLKLLQALCGHIAGAVHNACAYRNEREERERMMRDAHEARGIQRALLPNSSPYIPGYAVSGVCVPSGTLSGDWYDFIAMDGGLWALVLADVSGKGTAAALLMAATRGILRSLAQACCTPGEVLDRLNRLLLQDFPPARFVTMVYAVLDPAKGTVRFANAGHLQPLLIQGGEARFLSTDTGLPLGVATGEFSETEITLSPGSRLVFYTDGITEAENPAEEQYGERRLLRHLAPCDASAESLLEDVREFADGYGLHDDATIITVKRLG